MARCRQSLSRRSPTAPFAQGSRLCCPGNNRPRFCCPVREHRSPPCAKGGQHGKAMQGGLTALNPRDDTRCRVWLSLARCRQSLSRRSPTAPFAQGSRLCLSALGLPSAGAQYGSGGTPPIPQSAFADSSLCTREVRWPDGHTVFAFLRTTGLARQRSMGPASRWPRLGREKGRGKT